MDDKPMTALPRYKCLAQLEFKMKEDYSKAMKSMSKGLVDKLTDIVNAFDSNTNKVDTGNN